MKNKPSTTEARLRALEAQVELLRERERRHEAEIAALKAKPDPWWIPYYPVYPLMPSPWWQIPGPNYTTQRLEVTCQSQPNTCGDIVTLGSAAASGSIQGLFQ